MKRLAGAERELDGLMGGGGQGVQVAHLAPGPWLGLAIEVQVDVGQGEGGIPSRVTTGGDPYVAEEIGHGGGRAEQIGRAHV